MKTSIKMAALGLIGCWCAQVSAQQTDTPANPQQPPASAPQSPAAPQTQPHKGTAQSEAGEPRADTSAATPQSEAGEPRAATSGPAAAPPSASGTGQKASGQKGSGQKTAGQKGPGEKAAGGADRLELGTATVTGDREQPKVMYIVPWKKSDIGDLAGKPMNSLVDEILAPVDRDVFKREVVYYKAVQADTSQNGARARPSDQGEK